MDHVEARRLASVAVDDPLTRDQERQLAVHLVGCPDCKSFYDVSGRVHAALAEAFAGYPDAHAVERAVYRSTTVLRGKADPGPLERPLQAAERTNDFGPTPAAPALEIPPPAVPVAEPEPTPAATPVAEEPPPSPPADTAHEQQEAAAPPPAPARPAPADPQPHTRAAPAVSEPIRISSAGAAPPQDAERPTPFDDLGPIPVSRRERRATRRDERGRRAPRGLLFAAIAGALGLAAVAALLVFQRPQRSRAPSAPIGADMLRRKVDAAFDDIAALTASFKVSRLGLYRAGDRILFANGTETGRVVVESPGKLREETSLALPNTSARKATTVQLPEEVRTLSDTDGRRVAIVSNYPFGPPDGPMHAEMGILEQIVGSPARLLVQSSDLRVVKSDRFAGRDAYEAVFTVEATPFTRADRITMLVDAKTFIPLRVERSLSREHAGVLGPQDLLGDRAVEAAFGRSGRAVTEVAELDSLEVNGVVLPGEFVLAVPQGSTEQTQDAHWERVQRPQLAGKLPFEPLVPSQLPAGFRDRTYAVFTGRTTAWGPKDSFPAPDAAMAAEYSDGKTTIVVSQRRIQRRKEAITRSPLAEAGFPLTTEKVVRGGVQLEYAIAPDVPPHVWGFVGDVFVFVTGYTTKDDLMRIAGSLGSPSASSPGAPGSPTVSGSPGASRPPGASASPGASPAARSSPSASPARTAAASATP